MKIIRKINTRNFRGLVQRYFRRRSRASRKPCENFAHANKSWLQVSITSCAFSFFADSKWIHWASSCETVDGNWASWTSYGSCSVTCGGGTQTRSRTCTNPAPQYLGQNCAGMSSESQQCNTHNCPSMYNEFIHHLLSCRNMNTFLNIDHLSWKHIFKNDDEMVLQ